MSGHFGYGVVDCASAVADPYVVKGYYGTVGGDGVDEEGVPVVYGSSEVVEKEEGDTA